MTLTRLRWRMRGAWLWPTFLVLMALDALAGHALPPVGDSQSLASAWLVGLWAMLIGIVALSGGAAVLIRRRRPDMPKVVARNYGGTLVIVAVSCVLLAAGLIHHPSVLSDRHALGGAASRSRSWIATHAPAAFRHDLQTVSVYTIQPGSVYRSCVFDLSGSAYCVVVNLAALRARSVIFDGHEPNAILSAGAN